MQDILLILFLVFLEGILSFDNALALAAMVRHLPPTQQRKALTYGIFGAYAFRFISLFLIIHVLENPWVRIVGGLYLVWVAAAGLQPQTDKKNQDRDFYDPSFWRTIVLVELTDIFFSIDSILASAAVSQVLWIVLIGGLLGILMMRFVSGIFIKLMEKFPHLETAAFLLVLLVGLKLLMEGCLDVEFTRGSIEFIGFWVLMASSLLFGFSKRVAA